MNQLKRNVLLGLGLCALSAVGTASAQQPANQGASAATPAPAPPKPAQQKAALPGEKPQRQMTTPPGAAHKPVRPAPGPGSGPRDAKGGPRPEGHPNPGKALKGPPGEARRPMARPARPSPTELRQRRLAAAELRRAERSYFALQKLRMSDDEKDKAELKKLEQRESKAERKALRALRRAQKAHLAKAPKLSKAERKALSAKLDEAAKKRAQDRKERAEARRQELQKAYGKKLEKPAVAEELRRHAWRVARLERLLDMATAMDKPQQVEQAEKLLEKEKELHAVRLKAFGDDKMPSLPPAFEYKKKDKQDGSKKDGPKPRPKAPSQANVPATPKAAEAKDDSQ